MYECIDSNYIITGTQFKSYADGLFVGSSPLGPFQFQKHSPMSSKPTGFAAGAGHGSTFGSAAVVTGQQDCGKACNDHSDCSGGCNFCSGPGGKCEEGLTTGTPVAVLGQMYHIATSSVSVKARFERRLGIYPTLLIDNRLLVDTYLGDYPHELPARAQAQAQATSAQATSAQATSAQAASAQAASAPICPVGGLHYPRQSCSLQMPADQ